MAKKLVAERKGIIKTYDSPFLIIIKNYLLLDNQAFKFLSSKEGLEGLSAAGVVISSPFQKILTNFRLIVSRHYKRFRVFNETSQAKLWLFKYILENEDDFYKTLLSSE